MTAPEFPSAPELLEAEPVLEWHRLDLRMLIVRPLNELLGLIPVLVGLIVLGGGDKWRIAMSGGVIVLVVLFGLLSWFTTRYRITDEQVELHTGLLVRKRLAVPRDRIRTVDLTAKLGRCERHCVEPCGCTVEGRQMTLCAQGRVTVSAEDAHLVDPTSRTASANASGAS